MKTTPSTESAPISFSNWNWGIEINDIVSAAVKSSLDETFKQWPPEIAMHYHGEGSPLTLTVELPFSEEEFDPNCWDASLSDVLNDWLANFTMGDGLVHKDYGPWVRNVATALRAEADRIEARIEPSA